MRKIDKKLENTIRGALNQACDRALDTVEGFQWLTHLVDYQQYPSSLRVVCIFNKNVELTDSSKAAMRLLVQEKLFAIDVKINNIDQLVRFDTEENCFNEHNGKWQARLKLN